MHCGSDLKKLKEESVWKDDEKKNQYIIIIIIARDKIVGGGLWENQLTVEWC